MATRARRRRPAGSDRRRTRATGAQAARRHPGEVAARRRSWTRRPPPRAHPHPHAGGRGDGPQAAGRGCGVVRGSPLLLGRVAPGGCWRGDAAVCRGERAENAGRSRASPTDCGHPEVIARCNCAMDVQAARRHPGEVAARRRSWMLAQWSAIHRPAPYTSWMLAPPSRRASPSARRRDLSFGESQASHSNRSLNASLQTLIAAVRSSRVSEALLEYPPVPPQAYFSSALNP
jgi:hypothetical protein